MGTYNEARIHYRHIIQFRIFENQRPNDGEVDVRRRQLTSRSQHNAIPRMRVKTRTPMSERCLDVSWHVLVVCNPYTNYDGTYRRLSAKYLTGLIPAQLPSIMTHSYILLEARYEREYFNVSKVL